MRKGEEEEEDDWEGGSTRELESADPSACKPAALQPQRNGGCRRDWLVHPGGLCFVPVEGEIASSPLLDHCVMIQVRAGDVIITRDATGAEERCCHCLQITAFSFPYLFFLVQLQSLPARPQAGAACPRCRSAQPPPRWLSQHMQLQGTLARLNHLPWEAGGGDQGIHSLILIWHKAGWWP